MKTLRLSKKLPQFCGGLSGQKSMGGKEYISSCVRRSETKENYGMVESNEKKGDDDQVQPWKEISNAWINLLRWVKFPTNNINREKEGCLNISLAAKQAWIIRQLRNINCILIKI